MNIAKKRELAEQMIDRIIHHEDADSATRLGALAAIEAKISAARATLIATINNEVNAEVNGTPG